MNIIYWLLIISSFNSSTFKTNSQPQMEAAVCGNSICESSLGENCETCPGDCPCSSGNECVGGECTTIVGCGNLFCESFLGESCGNCPGDCPCPPGQICNNGICTFDTSGFVGVNNVDPKTALDISGALAHRSITIQASNDTINIPENVSLAVIVGYNPMFDSITIFLPINEVDGQRLIIKNATTIPLYVNTFFNTYIISQTHNSEFIYTTNNGWSLLGKSEDVNTSLLWNLAGNQYTSPYYDYIGTVDSTDLSIRTNGNERVRVKADGRVSLGLDLMDNIKFGVKSTNQLWTGFFKSDSDLGVSGTSYAVYGQNNSRFHNGNIGGYFEAVGNCSTCFGQHIGVKAYASGGNGNIGLVASSPGLFSDDLAAHFQQGNVKVDNNIGLRISPVSNTVLNLNKPSNIYNAAKFLFENGARGFVNIGVNGLLGSSNTTYTGLVVVANTSANDLAVFAQGKSIFLDELAIGLQGFTPGYKLSVDGKIIAEELRIQNSIDWEPWPDYVFAKNYNLRNLKQLKEFINKNSHLPEVPSATEVKENGIEVGDMQRTLLKKIEELTLYIIDQQKQIEELKKSFENNKVNK